MTLLPIFLRLDRRPCLVVGAGTVALAKIESLGATRAEITVWQRRAFEAADLEGIFLVIAATNATEVNHSVYEEALRRNVLCNAVDDPPNCDFYFGSVVARGDLQIAISTAGESPAVAQRLRREIDAQLPDDLGPWLEQLGALRREVRAGTRPGEVRNLLLHELARRPLCGSEDCPTRVFAQEQIRERPEEVVA